MGQITIEKNGIRDEALEELLTLAKSHEITVIWMNAGDIWEKDGMNRHIYRGKIKT